MNPARRKGVQLSSLRPLRSTRGRRAALTTVKRVATRAHAEAARSIRPGQSKISSLFCFVAPQTRNSAIADSQRID